jgi:hypothetical protein
MRRGQKPGQGFRFHVAGADKSPVYHDAGDERPAIGHRGPANGHQVIPHASPHERPFGPIREGYVGIGEEMAQTSRGADQS